MAVFKEIWMAARSSDDMKSYTPLGYSPVESEAVALCKDENDFVSLMDAGVTGVGTPLPGYWPMQGQTSIHD